MKMTHVPFRTQKLVHEKYDKYIVDIMQINNMLVEPTLKFLETTKIHTVNSA